MWIITMYEVQTIQPMDPQDKFELTRLRVSPRTLRNYDRDLQLFLN
jgi:hypothetical protein